MASDPDLRYVRIPWSILPWIILHILSDFPSVVKLRCYICSGILVVLVFMLCWYITCRLGSLLSCSTLSIAIMLWKADGVWPWATLCWDTLGRLVSLLLYSILSMAIMLWRADSVWAWATLCLDTPGRFVSLPSYLTLCVAIMLWKGRWHLTLSYAMLGYYGILVLAYLWCLESFNTYCQICAHRNQTMMLHLLWLTCGTLNLLTDMNRLTDNLTLDDRVLNFAVNSKRFINVFVCLCYFKSFKSLFLIKYDPAMVIYHYFMCLSQVYKLHI